MKERRVSYLKAKKQELVELCELAKSNNLEIVPNCFTNMISNDIAGTIILPIKKQVTQPENLSGTADLSHLKKYR